ncbi:hypothetical protein ZWY2020_027337 [Hordeum vulgare]|nr:hypothetical protein ZWY2020_027337 [Hordeum vulgare]
MHAIEADELSRSVIAYRKERQQDEEAELRAWKAALTRRFAWAGELGASGVPRDTFVGSTVLVALVLHGRIIVANCGDSRAGPLSQDHKMRLIVISLLLIDRSNLSLMRGCSWTGRKRWRMSRRRAAGCCSCRGSLPRRAR